MTEQMMLATSVHIWLRVIWSSFFLNCFVFINPFPLEAIFTAALFSSCLLWFPAALWLADMEEWADSKNLGLAPCKEKKTHFKSKFLSLLTKGVLTIYFVLDIIILTCSTKMKHTLCCLMEVHFQLFKPVCKQQLIWLSPYNSGYLAVFLCTCQYPVSWCHFKLCTVPCTHSAIHAHQPQPP